ncbi:MAG: hypothetical protein JW706_03270 [Opitutales bacterium]|nr:hypothetical protein [Opitutales bacterium]
MDNLTAIQWYAGMIPIFGCIIFCVWKMFGAQSGRSYARVTLGLYLLLMVYSRSLSLFVPYPFNPDEAQYVAQAMLFLEDPIPWTHVDTTTGGPLGTYAIMIPSLLGIGPGYGSARIIAIFLIWGSCVFGFKTLRLFLAESWALVVIFAPVLFWAYPSGSDFIHYSSELVPVLLLSASFYYLASAYLHEERFDRLLVSIALASLVPFAKLQASVIAFPIAIIGVCGCFHRNGIHGFVRRFPWVVLAGLALPFVILLPVCMSGGWMDFVSSYLELGVRYGAPEGVFRAFVKKALLESPSVFVCGAAQLAIIAVYVVWEAVRAWNPDRRLLSREWIRRVFAWPMVPAIIVFLAGIYAIAKPGTGFPHYWQLIVIPSSVIGGLFISRLEIPEYPFFSKLPTVGLLGAFVYSMIWFEFLLFNARMFNPNSYEGDDVHATEVVSFINAEKVSGDRMTVWGWLPDVYVKTGLVSGTREVCTQLVIPDAERAYRFIAVSRDLKAYYQERFMRDIERSRPAFVVDACYPGGFGFKDKSYSPECFRAFWIFLKTHYDLVLDTSTADSEGMRVWRIRSIPVDDTN